MQQTRDQAIGQLIDALSTTGKLLQRAFAPQAAAHDLSPAQFKLLVTIDNAQLTSGELANRLYMTPSAVTQAIEPLVKSEYVSRTHDPLDRRLAHLKLTKRGAKKLAVLTKAQRQLLSEMLAPLSDEDLASFLTIQHKLIAALELTTTQKPDRI